MNIIEENKLTISIDVLEVYLIMNSKREFMVKRGGGRSDEPTWTKKISKAKLMSKRVARSAMTHFGKNKLTNIKLMLVVSDTIKEIDDSVRVQTNIMRKKIQDAASEKQRAKRVLDQALSNLRNAQANVDKLTK